MSDTITLKKDMLWKASTFILALVVIWMVALDGDSNSGKTVNNVPSNNVAAPSAPSALDMDELVDDDAFLGDADAPVVIVEWSDYQCPFCRRFWEQTLPELKSEYIDTGKVKLVYRDFPLGFHAGAKPAAQAAECAREIGGDEAYFEMHDKIFEEQGKQGQGTVQFTADDVKNWATEIGYDVGECMDSGKFDNEINDDLAAGSTAGITGTPGFIINGKLVSGAQPFSVFKQVIDAELA